MPKNQANLAEVNPVNQPIANPVIAPIVNATQPSPLEKHVGFFSTRPPAGIEPEVTYQSMLDQLIALGQPEKEAASVANTVSFFGAAKITGCPYHAFKAKDAVGTLNHPRDTGIYNQDGSLNEERWDKLCTYSEEVNGVRIISETKMYEFIKWARDNDPRWDLFWIGAKASDGEWSTFFDLCTNFRKPNGPNTSERCVTLQRLRSFFEDSAIVFNEVIAQRAPQ